jgi:hypothetical protein
VLSAWAPGSQIADSASPSATRRKVGIDDIFSP